MRVMKMTKELMRIKKSNELVIDFEQNSILNIKFKGNSYCLEGMND